MTKKALNQISVRALSLALALFVASLALAQTPTAPAAANRGVIRLLVKMDAGAPKTEGFARKRFFLIKGSLKDNDALVQEIKNQKLISRRCFYESLGATPQLIDWFESYDCESVFCPQEIDDQFLTGPKAVPEFVKAVGKGVELSWTPQIARKWLIANLDKKIRDGYYEAHKNQLQVLIKKAEEISKAPVNSVMTDRNGQAFFTGLEAGKYVLSNLIPAKFGDTTELWNCDIEVPAPPKPPAKPNDLGVALQWLISHPGNKKDKNIKCVAVEQAPPACPGK